MATAGGLIRDEKWIRGFFMIIGKTTCAMAEIWGIRQGMFLAKSLEVAKLIIEADAKWIIDALNKDEIDNSQMTVIVKDCVEMKEGWVTEIRHTLREGNRCVDRLAKMALEKRRDCIFWKSPPDELQPFLQADSHGLETLRW
ncbi:uncharacterized protein LOC120194390 [Hibiscus syriacus]|uniref:uncharacterized protein LOC120194390 n=1 Tax=Hibiscus syriacus TaxID=106335 RepID=UPI001922B701|nr:uncharacterized protein LOC120194390 [Hibiscus syriacus]